MQINHEELFNRDNFKEIKRLKYDSIIPFVFENIKHKNWAVTFYLFINSLYLAILAGISVYGFLKMDFNGGTYFSWILWGILGGSFVVIPFHEAFHGLAYKLQGAPKIHFGADMKQMLFYVAADKYVIGRRSFYVVALTPFMAINIITLVFTPFLSAYMLVMIFTFLLLHNIMCIGDFAMVSYFAHHKDKELFTFDDHQNRISYIFERV